MRKRGAPTGTGYLDSYAEVNEVELDPVRIFYDASPAEPDVNWAGGLEIEAIEYKGDCVMHRMTDREIEAVRDQVSDYLNSYDDGYGDYLYEQRRDERLMGGL